MRLIEPDGPAQALSGSICIAKGLNLRLNQVKMKWQEIGVRD